LRDYGKNCQAVQEEKGIFLIVLKSRTFEAEFLDFHDGGNAAASLRSSV